MDIAQWLADGWEWMDSTITRVAARLGDAPPHPGSDWPWRAVAAAWITGLAGVVAAALWPATVDEGALAPAREGGAGAPGVPRLTGQRLTVMPPGYTGLPPRALDLLDARVPEGSRLEWRLRFAPQPAGAAIVSPGGAALVCRRSTGST